MNRNTTRLLVPNDAAYLGIIGSYVAEAARQAGFPEDQVAQVRLAVGEACKNVIQHAYSPDFNTHYHVTCEITPDQLCIKVWDGGPAFDLAGIPSPNLQPDGTRRRLGGLGLYLIRQWMDEVHLHPCSQGKELLLLKHTRPKKEET